jgi:hypothetical protein
MNALQFSMTVMPRTLTNFRIDPELLDALRTIRVRDGLPIAEQIRRAISAWVTARGVKVKTERKRAGTRSRS